MKYLCFVHCRELQICAEKVKDSLLAEDRLSKSKTLEGVMYAVNVKHIQTIEMSKVRVGKLEKWGKLPLYFNAYKKKITKHT